MTVPITQTAVPPRRLGRSVGAVLSGFLAVAVFSLVTDHLFHVLAVYPPWGEPMWDAGDNLLALAILGTLGALAGAIATIPQELGPDWYPVALVLTSFPLVWFGGVLQRK